eukprot:scaffold85962_cov43-Attheya_sp.AAC.4
MASLFVWGLRGVYTDLCPRSRSPKGVRVRTRVYILLAEAVASSLGERSAARIADSHVVSSLNPRSRSCLLELDQRDEQT